MEIVGGINRCGDLVVGSETIHVSDHVTCHRCHGSSKHLMNSDSKGQDQMQLMCINSQLTLISYRQSIRFSMQCCMLQRDSMVRTRKGIQISTQHEVGNITVEISNIVGPELYTYSI